MDGGRIHVGEPEQPEGHPFELIDIEDRDGLEQAGELFLAPGEQQKIAFGIRAHGLLPALHELQDLLHLLGRDVAQRHHRHLITAPLHGAYRGRQGRARDLGGREHSEQIVFADQHRAVHLKERLEDTHQRVLGHRTAGLKGHPALNLRVDGVVPAQDVPEDRLDDLDDVGAIEVEGDVAVFVAVEGRWGRGLLVDEPTGAGVELTPAPLLLRRLCGGRSRIARLRGSGQLAQLQLAGATGPRRRHGRA